MGVRIDAYAIDTPRLAELLERPVGDLLSLYAATPSESDVWYLALDSATRIHFTATPDGRLGAGPEGRQRWLSGPDELRTFPQLQQTGREWYSGRELYEVSHLLQALGDCPGVTCVTRLLDGHRRWWIGGVLDAASRTWGNDDDRTLVLIRLFRKILRDWGCDYPLPKEDIGVDETGLPFAFGAQEDDPGYQYGRWTSKECRAAVTLLEEIRMPGVTFRCPPDEAQSDDDDWHEWVSYNVDNLLRLKTLGYAEPDLVTVIS